MLQMLQLVSPGSRVLSLKTREEQNQRQKCQTEGAIHQSFSGWEWLNLTRGERARELEFKVFLMVPKLWAGVSLLRKNFSLSFPSSKPEHIPSRNRTSKRPLSVSEAITLTKGVATWLSPLASRHTMSLGRKVGYLRELTGDPTRMGK